MKIVYKESVIAAILTGAAFLSAAVARLPNATSRARARAIPGRSSYPYARPTWGYYPYPPCY